MRARQTKGSPHAPEIPTPTPAVNLRFNIDGLTKGRERVGGLLVGEVEEEPDGFGGVVRHSHAEVLLLLL